MSDWGQILILSFGAQLAALPGEKGQFAIGALATRYRPSVIVAAAAAAFGGWTVLEILVGNALRGWLSPALLAATTGVLFLAFGFVLLRSAIGWPSIERVPWERIDVPRIRAKVDVNRLLESERYGGFLPVFALLAVAEFGDKTQLITIGLAASYGASSAIWVGEMLAILPVSILNVLLVGRIAHHIDRRRTHLAGAVLLLFFGLDTFAALLTGFSVWETVVGAAVGVVGTSMDVLVGLV